METCSSSSASGKASKLKLNKPTRTTRMNLKKVAPLAPPPTAVEATTKGKGTVAPPIAVTKGEVTAVVAPPTDATKVKQIAKAVVAPPAYATTGKDDATPTYASQAKVKRVQQPPANITDGKQLPRLPMGKQ